MFLSSPSGYVLQQCAFNNCQDHFFKIINNYDLTVDDMMYNETGGDENKMMDNPLMIAAKQRHKDILTSVLRCPKFQMSEITSSHKTESSVDELLHQRNADDQTLLAMVALQGSYLVHIFFTCHMSPPPGPNQPSQA